MPTRPRLARPRNIRARGRAVPRPRAGIRTRHLVAPGRSDWSMKALTCRLLRCRPARAVGQSAASQGNRRRPRGQNGNRARVGGARRGGRDGQWVYVAGPKREYYGKEDYPAVFRSPLPARGPAERFSGDLSKTGTGRELLGGPPRGLAGDGKGHLLISDSANDRTVVVSEKDGAFLGPIDLPRPDHLAADRCSGHLDAMSLSGKNAFRLLKLDNSTGGKVLARAELRWRGNPAYPPVMALDPGGGRPVVWIGAADRLLRIEDLGECFASPLQVTRNPSDTGAFRDVVVDWPADPTPLRENLASVPRCQSPTSSLLRRRAAETNQGHRCPVGTSGHKPRRRLSLYLRERHLRRGRVRQGVVPRYRPPSGACHRHQRQRDSRPRLPRQRRERRSGQRRRPGGNRLRLGGGRRRHRPLRPCRRQHQPPHAAAAHHLRSREDLPGPPTQAMQGALPVQ